jgi:hypothetical protein
MNSCYGVVGKLSDDVEIDSVALLPCELDVHLSIVMYRLRLGLL